MFGRRAVIVYLSFALALAACALPATPNAPATATPTTAALRNNSQPMTPQPTSPATPAPLPTPVMQLALTGAPVQAWTDPNLVTGILALPGEVWAATQSGVVRWDLDSDTMARYGTAEGLAALSTRGIAVDSDGRIWIGYAELDAWSVWDGQSWQTYDQRERAVEAHYDAMVAARRTDPRLWTNRADSTWVWLPEIAGRAESYDGQRWRLYGENRGVRSGTWLVDVSVDGQVWAVGSAVSTVFEGEVYWDDHSYYSGMGTGCAATSASVDARGGLWVGYACESGQPGGLMYWDLTHGRWRGYEQALNPLLPAQVYWTHTDQNGTVWVGGDDAVIWKDPESPWRRLDITGLQVRAVQEPAADGLMWLGTDQGLVAVSQRTGAVQAHLRIPAPAIPPNVLDVATAPDGSIWVATERGVLSVDVSTGKLESIYPDPIVALAGGPHAVWLAGPGGVSYAVDGGDLHQVSQANVRTLTLSPESEAAIGCTLGGELLRIWPDGTEDTVGNVPALFGATAKALAVGPDGVLWVATGVGLGRISPEGEAQLLTVDDGLPNNDVLALALGPEDELWIGTRNGLARLRTDGRWTRFTTQSTEGGLRSMTVRDLTVGPGGMLWIATGGGISSREPEEADWAYYDLAGARAVAMDAQGNAWIGTNAGLVRVAGTAMTPVP